MANWCYSKISIHLKKPMVIIGFLWLVTTIKAQQNLVPNSGFDSLYTLCNGIQGITNVYNWYSPNGSSPDVFYYCLNQFPISDSNYVGIALYLYNSIGDPKEFIGVELTHLLIKDITYCVEFNVSLADSANYAISSIGAYFSTDSIYSSCGNCPLYFSPQIQNDSLNIITDNENWVKISGSFIANGGEQYLTIGNFNNYSFTGRHSLKVNNSKYDYAYYYIDNVSVYACDSPVVEEPKDTTFVFIPNVFSPNQDGENDLWEVTGSKVNSLNVQVFNRWGEQVYMFNSQNLQQDASTSLSMTYSPAWDGYTPTGKPVPEGTYFYIVQYTLPSGETKVEKGHLTLIR